MEITEATALEFGLKLTENINIDVLTGGVQNPLNYPLNITRADPLPEAPSFNLGDKVVPNWKVVRNLQVLSERAIEPLITEYGSDLHILTGYVNPGRVSHYDDRHNKHYTGEAIDVFLPTYAGNMYSLGSSFLGQLNGNITEIGLIFSQTSWLHIGVNGPHGPSIGDASNPLIYTYDMARREYFSGFYPARGFYVPKIFR